MSDEYSADYFRRISRGALEGSSTSKEVSSNKVSQKEFSLLRYISKGLIPISLISQVRRYAVALLGLLVVKGLGGCSPTSDTQNPTPTDGPSLLELLEDTSSAPGSSGPLPKAYEEEPTSQPQNPPKPLPPPKKEPWMDTLLDLSGVPTPNSAVLLEEDPLPRNLSSVEILISQRYAPKKPVFLSLRVYVTETGAVRRVQVLRNSDPKLTEAYFLPPLLELRFSPALYNGKPTSAWTTINLQIKP